MIAGRAGDGACGVADHSLFLAVELAKLCKHCQIFFFHVRGSAPRAEYRQLINEPNLNLVELSNFSLFNLPNVISLINSLRVDVVHLQYPAREYRFSLMPLFFALNRESLRASVFVLTVHEYMDAHPLRRFSVRAIVSHSDLSIIPSCRNFRILQGLGVRSAHYVPNGAFFHKLIPAGHPSLSAFQKRALNLLHFGIPSKTKRLRELVDLVSDLRRTSHLADLTLTLVGGNARISALLRGAKNSSGRFVSFMPAQDVSSLCKLAQESILTVFPFTFDTHRSSLINALGLPSPVYCFGVEKELKEKFGDLLPFHPEDNTYEGKLVSLREVLSSLNSDFSKLGRLALSRQGELLRRFSIENIAKDHFSLYNSLLGGRNC